MNFRSDYYSELVEEKMPKYQKIFILTAFVLGIVVLLTALGSSAECTSVPTNACTVSSSLTLGGGTYYINQSIQINSNGIILDGNGSKIIYSNQTTSLPYAILVENFNNTIIKNFILNQSLNARNISDGIHLTGITFNNTIRDNIIFINNLSSVAIYSKTGNQNSFINNTIYSFLGGILGSNSKSIEIENYSSNNLIINNTIFTYGSYNHGIYLELHDFNNTISGNKIFTSGYKSIGISLDTNATYNSVLNNNITTNGSESEAIKILEDPINEVNNTKFNNISYNSIFTFSNFSYGLSLSGKGVTNNYIFYNNITTNSSSAHGLYENGATIANNTFAYNYVNTTGASSLGHYVLNGAGSIISFNNLFYTSTSFSRGFRLSASSNNNFTNDYIKTISSNNGQGIYLESGGNNNLFNNISIVTPTTNKVELVSGSPNITLINMVTDLAQLVGNNKGNYTLINSNISMRIVGNVSNVNIDNRYFLSNLIASQFNYTSTTESFSLKNIDTSTIRDYTFDIMNNALVYSSNGSIYGNSDLSLNDGEINISIGIKNTTYFLNDFNVTENVARQFSPISVSGTSTSKTITSTLSQSVNASVIVGVSTCTFTATYQGSSVSEDSCTNNRATFTLNEIPSGASSLTLSYNPSSYDCNGSTSTLSSGITSLIPLATILMVLMIFASIGLFTFGNGIATEIKSTVYILTAGTAVTLAIILAVGSIIVGSLPC